MSTLHTRADPYSLQSVVAMAAGFIDGLQSVPNPVLRERNSLLIERVDGATILKVRKQVR